MSQSEKKICFCASSGGHFEQLMTMKPLMNKYDSFILTEKTQYAFNTGERIYFIPQVNRKQPFILIRLIACFFLSYRYYLKEKPDVVISTGALATIPICLIMKVHHRKFIYIESFAKVTSPTRSGRFLYPLADRFYVQWESMLKIYPKAIYLGAIY